MIYFTTFILTHLLSHIARATPTCSDVSTPEELYDPSSYADSQADQHLPMAVVNVTWTTWYDNKNGDTKKTACPDLAGLYPDFKNFPEFPYIGGIYNIIKGAPLKYCGSCWKLTHGGNKRSIYITVMDSATNHGFNISKTAFNALTGGLGNKTLLAEATPAPLSSCGGPK